MSAMISPGVNLVISLIGFAVSTMFIVFVCTRLICARIHLNASARSFPTASRSDLSMLEQGLHGLDPVVVATFPTKKYGDGFLSAGEDVQCTVCLAEYQDKDILRILPSCGHFFHMACIDVWLQQHSTCPVCRISLSQSPDRRHPMQPMFSSAVQSTYSTDSPNSHSYHFLYVRYGYSSGGVRNQRMEPIQVDHLASEVHTAESGDSISIFTRGNRAPKDIGLHEPGKLHHESPSNS